MHISKSDRGCLNDNEKSKALKANFKLTLFSYYGHLFFLRYLTKSIQQQQEQREKYNNNSNSDLFLQWFLQISISFSKDSRCYAKELFLKYNSNFERYCKIHLLVTYLQTYFPVDTPHAVPYFQLYDLIIIHFIKYEYVPPFMNNYSKM